MFHLEPTPSLIVRTVGTFFLSKRKIIFMNVSFIFFIYSQLGFLIFTLVSERGFGLHRSLHSSLSKIPLKKSLSTPSPKYSMLTLI
jgi:hypothetical protein